jgi:cation:H+ antiporter
MKKEISGKRQRKKREESHILRHLTIAMLGFVGVAVGALAVVQSVIMLSDNLGIPEFFISFFVLGIGTSIPELVVDFTAIRRRQYEFAIGDILGSCIVDATISVSIGQFLFPTPVFVESSGRSILLALYTIIASATVILTLSLRKKIDKKAGILFVLVYSISYVLFFL